MNNVTIMGRLGQDPEIKYIQAGDDNFAVGNYSIACDRRKKNGEETITDWIPCKVSGKNAEFAEKYLKKGMKILISGKFQVDTWKDDEGHNRSFAYVQVTSQEFCESKNATQDAKPTDADGFMPIPENVDDDLPFV